MELAYKDFRIDIFKLSNSEHEFQFFVDDTLFKLFESSLVEKGKGEVIVKLKKSSTLISLRFFITGNIELTCDKSLKRFDFPLNIEKELILKYGDEEAELTDEIEMIHWDTESINVAQYIYEFIGLEIPMRKLHPSLKVDIENKDNELIYSTNNEDNNPDKKEANDPRWDDLKAFKNLKDNTN